MITAGKMPGLSRRFVLTALAASGVAAVFAPSAWAVGAVKHYILIELKPGADQLALDRWYMTYHAPQVRRAFKAWQRNYVSFRSYDPPQEAVDRFGVANGRMTEIHFDSLADFAETRPNNLYGGLDSYTPPPGGWRANQLFTSTTMTIPVNPNEVYVTAGTPPKETPYLRWIVFLRAPDGVDLEAAESWWRDVHAPELAGLAGLKRFVRYASAREAADYSHVVEFWFDDYADWAEAFLDPEQKFTAAPWGGRFPFLETKSMFIGENPDMDFIHDDRVIP